MAAYKTQKVFGEHFSYPVVRQCIEARESFYTNKLKIPRRVVVDGFDWGKEIFHVGLFVSDTCVASVRGNTIGMARGRCRLEWLAMTDGCRGVNAAHALIRAFEQVMSFLNLTYVRADVPSDQTQAYYHCGFQESGGRLCKHGLDLVCMEKSVTSP